MERMQIVTLCLALAGLLAGACKEERAHDGNPEIQAWNAPTSTTPSKVVVEGAGSTFIYPLMSRWSAEYAKSAPLVDVDYQPLGSHEGVIQLRDQTVNFAATDAPMNDDELTDPKTPVVHIPVAMGAVVPTYNLPQFAHPVRFTPDVLAGIYLGTVKVWNDPKIAADNPDLPLPPTPIAVVHRSDGSGTTYVWADYLSKVSPDRKRRVGAATLVDWPVGLSGHGNEGVADIVRKKPGAIGYVELNYALSNKMPVGSVKNKAGRFVQPTTDSVLAATTGLLSNVPDDLRYSVTDAPAEAAWPISGTTWAVVPKTAPSDPERRATIRFIRWTLHDGQQYCLPLDYVPLPPQLVERADAKLNALEPSAK